MKFTTRTTKTTLRRCVERGVREGALRFVGLTECAKEPSRLDESVDRRGPVERCTARRASTFPAQT